jgi:hypothetical protein
MNTEVKNVLAAKSNGQRGLISAPMKELLNLRQLPGKHHE